MSYKREEVTTKIIEVKSIKRDFFSFKKFNNVRKDIDKCQNCLEQFTDDNINLAMTKGSKNIVICNVCADHMLANGADEIGGQQ